MAKSKVRNKSRKGIKSSDLFNQVVRDFSKQIVKSSFADVECLGYRNVEFAINAKNFIRTTNKFDNLSNLSKDTAIRILDAMNDLMLIPTSNEKVFNVLFEQLRGKLVTSIGKEVFLCQVLSIIQITCLDVIDMDRQTGNKVDSSYLIVLIGTYYTIFLMSYCIKFKNKKIEYVSVKDGYEKIHYLNKEAVSNDDFEKLANSLKKDFKKNLSTGIQIFESFIRPIVKSYEKDEFVFFDNKYSFESVNFTENFIPKIFFTDESSDKSVFEEEELQHLFKNRRYGILPNGARFDFLDKSYGIDYIDIKENDTIFGVQIVFSDSSEVIVLERENLGVWVNKAHNENKSFCEQNLGSSREFATPIQEDFILSLEFDKEIIISSDELYKGFLKALRTPNLRIEFTSDRTTFNKLINILHAIINCLYIALCKPNYRQGFIRMYNIEQSNGRRFVNRKSAFRIAHLRRLPVGYESSTTAKEKAKRFGFTSIPKGYTFVGERTIENSNESVKIFKV